MADDYGYAARRPLRQDNPMVLTVLGFVFVLGGGMLTASIEEPLLGYLVMSLGGFVLLVAAVALGVQIGMQYYDDQRD